MATHDHVQLKTCQIVISNNTRQDVVRRSSHHASTIMLEADDSYLCRATECISMLCNTKRGTLFAMLHARSLRLSSIWIVSPSKRTIRSSG
ncbi:hypothetical protein D6C89_05311 [Aureobasidium pullulans]|nr:hypothetical protein D6C89_05311 [Aureobasidium pullulans]